MAKRRVSRRDINEYGQVQYHSAQVNKTNKKNKTITFLNSRRRDGRTSTEENAWPDIILLVDGTATTRTPGWKEIKNAKQKRSEVFFFRSGQASAKQRSQTKGKMVLFISARENSNKFKRINITSKVKNKFRVSQLCIYLRREEINCDYG